MLWVGVRVDVHASNVTESINTNVFFFNQRENRKKGKSHPTTGCLKHLYPDWSFPNLTASENSLGRSLKTLTHTLLTCLCNLYCTTDL